MPRRSLANSRWPALLLVAAYAVVVSRNAWICDDAYINLRTVDNLANGLGLTWNVGERVQAFTSPLWVLLVAVLHAFTHEVFFTIHALSIVLSVTAVSVFALGIAPSTLAALLGVLTLTLSMAFVDYSTSGLENPLTHLMITLFFWVWAVRWRPDRRRLFVLALVAAFCALSRMDTLLLLAPALAYRFWALRGPGALGAVALGFVPFVAWECFALVYFGFPFPNTAYAKLNTGIPLTELVPQGNFYLRSSLLLDPLTLVTIVAAVVVTCWRRRTREVVALTGMLLYVAYVVRIGGCFMSGRMLAAPMLVAVIIIAQHNLQLRRRWGWIPFATVLLLGLVPSRSPVRPTTLLSAHPNAHVLGRGVGDTQSFYFEGSSLLTVGSEQETPAKRWANWGREYEGPIALGVVLGYFGYYAPRSTYIIDPYALVDPLLARLPVDRSKPWRIGHFERKIPLGYMETVATGSNLLPNRALADYYDRLTLVTRGPLFSRQRFAAIVELNLGRHDHLLEEYLASPEAVDRTPPGLERPLRSDGTAR